MPKIIKYQILVKEITLEVPDNYTEEEAKFRIEKSSLCIAEELYNYLKKISNKDKREAKKLKVQDICSLCSNLESKFIELKVLEREKM